MAYYAGTEVPLEGDGEWTSVNRYRDRYSITNRSKLVLESIDLVVVGSNHVFWELCIGQAISGTTTFSAVNASSAFEYNTAGAVSGNPNIVIAQGYLTASAQTKSSLSKNIGNKYPISLSQAAAARANGTLSIVVTGISGTSDTRATLNWREIR